MTVMNVAVGAPERQPHSTGWGADLFGWSSLPLLGDVADPSAPWLFVTDMAFGWVTHGPVAGARFEGADLGSSEAWPFDDGALGGVVIDGDVADGTDSKRLARLLSEVTRAAAQPDNVLIVCRHRVLPRRLRDFRSLAMPSAQRWRRAAARFGRTLVTSATARFDDRRLTALWLTTGEPGDRQGNGRADRVVLRMARPEGSGTTAIASILRSASLRSGTAMQIQQISVRKIGKTAVLLGGGDDSSYIMRIARSPVALGRAERNFETLQLLHGSSLPDWMKRCVPQRVAHGREAGYEYFVETRLDGQAGPLRHMRATHSGWNMEAVGFISALHTRTVRPTAMESAALERLVREPAARVCRAEPGATRLLSRVMTACVETLSDRVLPLVFAHGDFTESNCLFDRRGTLAGVVDWELSMPAGLPLLDLLQLMPVPGESGASPRWQRFDAWLELWRDPAQVIGHPVMGQYIRDVGMPPDIVRTLLLLQWVTHVADRVEARRGDERWMRLRLSQPLESLGQVFA